MHLLKKNATFAPDLDYNEGFRFKMTVKNSSILLRMAASFTGGGSIRI